jgi:hypothetical protein
LRSRRGRRGDPDGRHHEAMGSGGGGGALGQTRGRAEAGDEEADVGGGGSLGLLIGKLDEARDNHRTLSHFHLVGAPAVYPGAEGCTDRRRVRDADILALTPGQDRIGSARLLGDVTCSGRPSNSIATGSARLIWTRSGGGEAEMKRIEPAESRDARRGGSDRQTVRGTKADRGRGANVAREAAGPVGVKMMRERPDPRRAHPPGSADPQRRNDRVEGPREARAIDGRRVDGGRSP